MSAPARPRILMVCEPPGGGSAHNAVELAVRLPARGFDVEYAGPPAIRRRADLEAAGTPVHELPLAPGYAHPRRDRMALGALHRLLRTGRFDLVHCHSPKAGVLGRVAARAAGVRAVYSPHCFPFVGDFSAARAATARLVEHALAPLTTAYVCVCEQERRLAREKRIAPAERLHVVHNGVEPCDDSAPDGALAATAAAGPLVGAVAELRRQKRLDLLVEATPAVLERVPDARIAIVGDGPLRDQLHDQARRLGLDREERFAFLPFEPPAARYLKALDVYVLPSAWEALPIGALEALACGIPQIATDVGGTGEAVVAATGVLVPPRDAGRLAEAIVALLRDPGRREEMAAASRARHAELFGVDRMVDRTAALYRRLLEPSGRRGALVRAGS
jgi:glycosyltransferase involved in cell wall biosynthesis